MLVVPADELADDLAAVGHLEVLRSAGVRVCVEGFGTHEGPTDRWSRLPVDLVRIDPQALSGGPLRSSLLRLTVETAHTFGWEVVGGGVTDADQVAALAEVGCEYAQGPMPRRTVQALTASSATHPQVAWKAPTVPVAGGSSPPGLRGSGRPRRAGRGGTRGSPGRSGSRGCARARTATASRCPRSSR